VNAAKALRLSSCGLPLRTAPAVLASGSPLLIYSPHRTFLMEAATVSVEPAYIFKEFRGLFGLFEF